MPPHLTGSDAWNHALSDKLMFNVSDTADLRRLSYSSSSGLLVHGAVLSRYIILGAVNTFRRRYKLSWDGMNFSLETKQLSSVLFEDIAMSMFFVL